MKCADIEDLLPDLAAGTPDLAPGVSAHIADCPECRRDVEMFKLLLEQDARRTPPSRSYWAGILPRLKERLGPRSGIGQMPAPVLQAGLAAAFCLLLAILVPAALESGRPAAPDATSPRDPVDLLIGGLSEEAVIDVGSTNGDGLTSALGPEVSEEVAVELLSDEARESLADAAGAEYMIAELSAEEFAGLYAELAEPAEPTKPANMENPR